MERRLAEFRARRQAESTMKKDDGGGPLCKAQTAADTDTQVDTTTTTQTTDSQQTPEAERIRASRQTPVIQDRSDWLLDSALGRWLASRRFVLTNLTLLKVLLWLVLLGLFVEIEFGLPFFVVSLFYWLYEGLRSPAARQPGEMSAYSVFNPDCQPLLGALTAEQLEGEMGYGHLASHLY
ncbi:SAYSvFN domain-containing protein 1 [Gasterosteus aculeatus]|uniref:SAYSvFN domain-containing protein n=2 Tax=Gasterosteus aculeatus TaxID=69293 RepID=A0AAQ4PMR9_GASAC|nr:SAYSvFN domain-containing protein 1 [Gasterosteus aculeatus aculeatus]